MGSGCFSASSYRTYSKSLGRDYDENTGRVTGQTYRARYLNEELDPRQFTIRECANSEEHPNTIPVILALDVTGSMGSACAETAAALGTIMKNLYEKFQDVEFCIMGIGDCAFDDAPIQMSQFESDIRIAEALDKLWMEKGGGGNRYESYTAAWYMGLYKTKLDCYDKQGRKGIIITMGDEPLNPYIPVNGTHGLNNKLNEHLQADIETPELYKEASKKFDIFHIAVNDHGNCYSGYKDDIEKSFGQVLGNRFKTSTINMLAKTIEDCIAESVNNRETGLIDLEVVPTSGTQLNENGEITW